ncbi:MAG: tripartite tricarboxylate transporter permease [Deltaproteobacteria bacterium]|nr:tripartite tricarboxylate transporter permease [Deltaproteobacteria bacterium]MBI2209513.1 tripartite tricarboxylate transporter permease [Deltaproteobacteria bacterium]
MFEMLGAFVSGFYQVLTPTTFGLMLVGIAVGFIVGILPGLGGPTTMALMLPFIFKMSAVEAFAFLLGMAAVTATTGDITSILFGVPGEPTTAATIVDGHPMAKKGEAGRALGAALMSSLVGAIFGALCLALAVPIVRPLVLTFGSPEFFMIALLGVTFVASLSGGALVKGLISGGLGFCLAMIGLDPISGIQRFTFGQLFLWDGIGLVPVTVGLFAIPEIVDLAVQGGSISKEKIGKLGGVMEGVKDTFRHWWLVIRCSALGAYIGIIPGMGGGVSQWIAYAHAVQSSPNKERFGRGAVEGVLGPGAANNSTLGGAFIPTVAFGVPGSVIMAILLGAFIIQGIVPGPDMLLPPPRGKLDLTFSFVWIIVVSNLITVGICFLFLNQLAKVTQIRSSLLMPFLLLLIYLGAFAEKNAFEDIIVVLVFGALGWVMVKLDWQRPPLLLGLVLGPLMENRLFLSTDNYGIAWLWRTGVLLLFALTLIGIFYPIVKETLQKKGKADVLPMAPVVVKEEEKGAVRLWDTLFTLFIAVLLAWALLESRNFGFRAGLFPWAIGLPVLALAIAQLILELTGRARRTVVVIEGSTDGGADLPREVVYQRTASICGWIIGFFVMIWLLGFSIAFPVTTLLYLKIAGREKWPITIILTLLGWGFFYGLFDYSLHVPFPDGQLFLWLK